MAQTTTRTDLAYLDAAVSLPATAEFALYVAVVMAKWSERQRSRRALRDLDDHLLQDIGVTRQEARVEAARPFWQGQVF